MSTFWDLYHQIIQSIIGNGSNTFAVIPEIKYENSQYSIPKQIFPAGSIINRIPDSEEVLEAIENLKIDFSSPILFMPPYGTIKDWSNERKKEFPGYRNVETIVLRNFVRRVKQDSVIVALMPTSFLALRSTQLSRKEIFSVAPPVTLIRHQFPWNELGIPFISSFQTCTIVMVKTANVPPLVRFFALENPKDEFKAKEILADFQKHHKQSGGQTNYGYVIRDRNQIEDQWNYDYHHPEMVKRKQDLSIFGGTRKISDIFEVRKGRIHNTNDAHLFVENTTNKGNRGAPLIEGRDLRPDGSLVLETRYCVVDPPTEALLKQGDILIRALYISSNEGEFPVVEVADDRPLTASHSVIMLRPLVPMSDAEKAFILAYLRSDTFLDFLSLENFTVNIQQAAVANIPVPIPDENMITALRSINEARTEFQNWIKDAEVAKNSIFKAESSKDARLLTLSAGRLARQRLEAGQLVEDYRHRIRIQFPHPLAYQWRAVEAGKEDSEGYDQVLNTAETALCYLACIAVTAANSIPEGKVKWLENIAQNLCEKGHGTSMGDWIAILRETSSSKAFKKSEEIIPFYEVIKLLSDKDIDSAVQRLKKKRDDVAHRRGPKGQKATQKAFKEAKSDLEMLFRAIDFLTEYPLRYIEATRRDSITRQTFYTYRELRGDHPFVPLAEDVCLDNELEAGSLYLVDRQKKLFLLRPLMLRKECPECGSWSTFYLDTFDSKTDTPMMKSMEHGHTSAEHDLSGAFRFLGLIS